MQKEKRTLIVSDSNDYNTKCISDWVIYLKGNNHHVDYLFTDFETLHFEQVQLSDEGVAKYMSDGDRSWNLNHFSSVFFRSGRISLTDYTGLKANRGLESDFLSRFSNYMMAYEDDSENYLNHSIQNCNTIGKSNGGSINKLKVLEYAYNSGLKIPKTLLTRRKSELLKFYASCDAIITKTLAINFSAIDLKNKLHYRQLTKVITEKELAKIDGEFALTLFQERIPKLFEVRAFFIRNRFFSCAILSQQNEKTQIDYRNYDQAKPNRIIPYQLPKSIESQLLNLSAKLKLQSGSFDLIVDTNEQYIFLEVNPAGQYGTNSDVCNFYLDREIAKEILKWKTESNN